MENTEAISCIAVGDMLKNKLEEYTNALSIGVDDAILSRMEKEIDNIEVVHAKCKEHGDVTDIGSHGDSVNEEESGGSIEEESTVYVEGEGEMFEEEDAN